ncbi:MAG: 16S rRNA (guanine(966)-N(2))-methyltransferase RsmD [Spirochaetales bacterium]|nr:16S rRNA (guanine(966)-N(2))-methyltransferase RsmD [Spirochaetales bacterium]
MRITGGIYSKRKIICPPGEIRPAMDMMRESIFSILGDLSGFSFCDLFTGSGVVGIEAASRGAAPVLLVEKDPGKIKIIKQNTAFVETEIKVMCAPVERVIKRHPRVFDYIFCDPPFKYPYKEQLISRIEESGMFSGRGLVILHAPRADKMKESYSSLVLKDQRTYGNSLVWFYGK